MVRYMYRRVAGFNGNILWRLLEKELDIRANFREYGDGNIYVDVDRELTDREKEKLDNYMNNPPETSTYDVPVVIDSITAITGVEPLRVAADVTANGVIVSLTFHKSLLAGVETKLKEGKYKLELKEVL